MKALVIFLACFIWFNSGCLSKGETKLDISEPAIQKTSIADAVQAFESKQSFWSFVKKTKFQNNQFYSLVFMKNAPTEKIYSSLTAHSMNGVELAVSQLPPEFTLIDFDVNSKGQVIQLGFREISGSDIEFGFPLKQLAIFVDSKKAFVLLDSKQNLSVRYDKIGNPSLAEHYDTNQTYFLTSSPMTAFAKIQATDHEIFISAVGTFGFKVFSFNYNGKELFQTEILPQTAFNNILLDREAPSIEISGARVLTALTISSKDAPIFQKHFGILIKWDGPEYQAIIQSFDLFLSNRLTQIAQGTADFFISGIHASEDEIAVFGSTGGPGNRKALATCLNFDLVELYRAEFTLTKESSLYAATFSKGQLHVAGGTGSLQVQTGSVVEAADSFVSVISSNGLVRTISRFGADRNDHVTSLLAVNDDIFLSGQQDGPITHTADADPNLGYQKWFLGKLKQP